MQSTLSSEPESRGASGAEPPRVVASFPELYRENFQFVWRVARSLGVPERRIEDAVQDVFIIVHRRLAEYDARASARAWLFEITRRVAHDHRRTVRRKETTEPLPEGLDDAVAPGPAQIAETAEDLRLVESIVAGMPEEQSVVFVLAEIEQMTAPEIAETLAIKLNTVYSRLRRAREAFHAGVLSARGEER
jgi:RNA polymerase sigma-70 factor (ECF subfamily)